MDLDNVLTKGSKIINPGVVDDTVKIPTNEDWQSVAEIVAYSKPKLTLKKIWDESLSPRLFYAIARYYGKEGNPETDEIEIGTHVNFYRVGVGNVDFSGTPTDYQLRDTGANKPSFVVFFFSSPS